MEIYPKTCPLVRWVVGTFDWLDENRLEEDVRESPCVTDSTRDPCCGNRSCPE